MSYLKNILFICVLLGLMASCSNTKQESNQLDTETENQLVQDEREFDPAASDAQAISLVDEVIAAHGGQKAWDNTRYISWNFLGSRDLVWDKYTGLVRIDFPREESTYIINVVQDTGRVKYKNKLIPKTDSSTFYINRGKQIWVNDAYWLVFPFKLKDPGVQLTYMGMDSTKNGKVAEVVAIQFQEVGYTPENKYYAYVDPQSKLILQWDYFSKAADSVPAISNVWSDYAKYGDIMLSGGRDERKLGNIMVSQEIDSAVFQF